MIKISDETLGNFIKEPFLKSRNISKVSAIMKYSA